MEPLSPTISVIVATYNHQDTISQCLTSILFQKCSYSFEIVIGDDCSTDNTILIINDFIAQFPDKIRLYINPINVGLVKNYFSIAQKCKGSFIAQCAGDDFWSDELKLEKQCSYLENHPDTGIIHSDYNAFIEKTGKTIQYFQKSNNRFFSTISSFNDLLIQGPYSPLTVMFRKPLLDQYIREIDPVNKRWVIEDYPFWIYLSYHTRADYMPDCTATYRIRAGTISRNEDKKKRIALIINTFLIEFFFAKHFQTDKVTLKLINKRYYKRNITLAWLSGNKKRSTISIRYLKNERLLSMNDRIFHFLTLCKFADYIFRFLRTQKLRYRNW